VEIDELKQLPNNVALAFPSTGEKTLPATYVYLRPLWVFREHPDLSLETPWLNWPETLRNTYDLDSMPQAVPWKGWDRAFLEIAEVAPPEQHLAGFIQKP
jgi:hypothetical protein